MKQVKMVLDAHNGFINHDEDEGSDEIVAIRTKYYGRDNFDLQPQVCVYYDAWENDNDDDPVMSLVYTILSSVDADFSFRNTDYIRAGASVMEVFSGKNWTQLIDDLKGVSPLETLRVHKDVDRLVGKFLDALLPEKGNRLVVLIDELDRCKPSYAVRLLERIKHYFTHDNITFVFSVNTNELQHTIKKHYGNDFDGSRYLDRFFDLRVTLSPPNLQNYLRSLHFHDGYYIFDNVCGAVINAYRFELREIAKFLRIVKIAAHHPTHSHEGMQFVFPEGRALHFCLCFIAPIMVGLRIQSAQRYKDFIEGRDFGPMLEIAEKVSLRVFDELLMPEETFDKRDKQRTYVTLEEKLKALYDAIFATSYTGATYQTRIGDMEFNAQTKDTLIRTAGLLSQFTNIDID